MITEITKDDLDRLREIVAGSVRGSVACSDEEAACLIEEIVRALDSWCKSGSPGFGRKYSVGETVAGFVVVRDYLKLTHLFVCLEFQGRGIGRALVEAAIEGCRNRSPHRKITLNSSKNAAGFYEAMGFGRTDPPTDKPGGCIPFEYSF
ncbi:MAG: GNAT family N-acetyltransferase [Planctomycetota bacterium]|jgi:GNAT superfamily N-acetyltransferase